MDMVQEEQDGGLVGGSGTTEGQNEGGLSYSGGYRIGTGGTQTSGGTQIQYRNGAVIAQVIAGDFGFGANDNVPEDNVTNVRQAGGGGGYYGGATSVHGGAGRRFIIY